MPASYQAAFALAALADAKDDEKEFDGNKETEAEKLMRDYKPVNHLASLDLSVAPITMADGGDVSEAKDTARKGQAYQELEKYLESRGETPSVQIGGYMPGGTNGIFTSDNLNIGSGTIKISKDTAKELVPSVLAHEMTHAVQNNLLQDTAWRIQKKIEQGEKVSDQERQFLRASEQIFANSFARMGNYDSAQHRKDLKAYKDQVRSQYTGTDKEYGSYRTSPGEAQAFGVGNMATSRLSIGNQVNPHLDPSMATEFDILLSMYQKLPESLRASSAAAKQAQIEKERSTSKDVYLQLSNDLLKNPFPPSIK
jgi:hypothetical protein